MEYDIASIIQGYAQGYFLMADEDGDNLGWYPAAIATLIPLDERFHYPKSLWRVLNQERFTVAINRDFKAVVTGVTGIQLGFHQSYKIYWELYQTGWAYSLKLGRATS